MSLADDLAAEARRLANAAGLSDEEVRALIDRDHRRQLELSADPVILRAVIESYRKELAEAVRLLRGSQTDCCGMTGEQFDVAVDTFLARHPEKR